MFHRSKLAALIAATTVLTLGATSAWADTVYNDLDATIDSAHESMSLTYDSATSTGSTGTTTLAIQIQGRSAGDHPGCNIQGGGHYITITPTSSDESVATVALSNGGRFDTCNDTVLATVTTTGIGTAAMTFGIDSDRTSNDPHLSFSLVEAAFDVTVVEGATSVGGGTRCDADPAAPAWAAALLKGNNVKAKATAYSNYISSVARAMGQGATFQSWEKNAHPAYETAVWNYMKSTLGLALPKGPAEVARPGWECTPAS